MQAPLAISPLIELKLRGKECCTLIFASFSRDLYAILRHFMFATYYTFLLVLRFLQVEHTVGNVGIT